MLSYLAHGIVGFNGKKKPRTSGARRRLLTSVGLARSDPGWRPVFEIRSRRVPENSSLSDDTRRGKITAGGVETRRRSVMVSAAEEVPMHFMTRPGDISPSRPERPTMYYYFFFEGNFPSPQYRIALVTDWKKKKFSLTSLRKSLPFIRDFFSLCHVKPSRYFVIVKMPTLIMWKVSRYYMTTNQKEAYARLVCYDPMKLYRDSFVQ